MRQYFDLLREVIVGGTWKEQRAVAGDGSRLRVCSVFGPTPCHYDLSSGFPIVTTKFVSFKTVTEELLWFLSGSTNNNDLKARGVKIWNEWADSVTGDLGPIYGKQWRRWETKEGGAVDQIATLINEIKLVVANPHHSAARRLILAAWNPAEMHLCKGPPACHTFSQYNVTDGKLNCQLYQRSADLFLGIPYNISCYALLTCLLARVTGLGRGKLIHVIGDGHIYENHLDQVSEQLSRKPLYPPSLYIDPKINNLDDFKWSSQVELHEYNHAGVLKGEVAI